MSVLVRAHGAAGTGFTRVRATHSIRSSRHFKARVPSVRIGRCRRKGVRPAFTSIEYRQRMRTTVLQSIVVAVIVCGASACTADDDGGGEGESSEGEGEGEEPGPSTCALACDANEDCFGGPCVDGACEAPPPTITPCNTDAECLGYANPFTWSTACVATSDCAETEACV